MTWADGDYSYKKTITVDCSKVPGDLANFPILVSVTDADLKDNANGGHCTSSSGYDICFYDVDDATLLKHELVHYVNTTGQVEIWVKVPVLDHDADTVIFMYYGNSNIVADQSDEATWDANYKMVQHMKDATTSTTLDSTNNNNDGTKTGANEPVVSTSGKITKCQDFDGSNDRITLPDMGTGEAYPFTFSCWFNTSNNTDPNSGLVCQTNSGSSTTRVLLYFAASTVRWNVRAGGGTEAEVTDPTERRDGKWHYAVGSSSAANSHKLWVDGSLIGTVTTSISAPALDGACIGDWTSVADYEFDGLIDEVRISNSARSENWTKTEYNNQNSPSTFMAFGVEQVGTTAWTKSLDNTITVSESLVRKYGYDRSISNTITISDLLASTYGHQRDIANTITISESLKSTYGHQRDIANTITVSEVLARKYGFNLPLSNTITVSELLDRTCEFYRSIDNTITVSELLYSSQGFKRALYNTITVSELLDRTCEFYRSIANTVTVSEFLLDQLALFRTLSNTITVSEFLSTQSSIFRTISNTVTVSESLIKQLISVFPWIFFDPRKDIRSQISSSFDIYSDGTNENCITVTDTNGNVFIIPIYLTEETKSNNSPLPTLPLIELELSSSKTFPEDVCAAVRRLEAIVRINIYWQKEDNVDQSNFGKLISDKLCDLIRTNQCLIPGTQFVNVRNTGRVITENYGRQVVYKRVMEAYALLYDTP